MMSCCQEDFSIAASSLVRDMNLPFEAFAERLRETIFGWPADTLLGVFPEYCWRTSLEEDVWELVRRLQKEIRSDLVLVLGTLDFVVEGSDKPTNNALVLYNSQLTFVPKTKVLKQDRANGVVSGKNPGVLTFPRFRLAVLVCADLWDVQLCYDLAHNQKANVFAVPCWSATRKGNRSVAKRMWHDLAGTRRSEYGISVVVADHVHNFESTDVANATGVFHPCNRGFETISCAPITQVVERLCPKKITAAVSLWNEKGLGQKQDATE